MFYIYGCIYIRGKRWSSALLRGSIPIPWRHALLPPETGLPSLAFAMASADRKSVPVRVSSTRLPSGNPTSAHGYAVVEIRLIGKAAIFYSKCTVIPYFEFRSDRAPELEK